jgi:hypothetical protein
MRNDTKRTSICIYHCKHGCELVLEGERIDPRFQPGAFRDKEMHTYNEEYDFRNAPALHPEKIDLIASQSVTWPVN